MRTRDRESKLGLPSNGGTHRGEGGDSPTCITNIYGSLEVWAATTIQDHGGMVQQAGENYIGVRSTTPGDERNVAVDNYRTDNYQTSTWTSRGRPSASFGCSPCKLVPAPASS